MQTLARISFFSGIFICILGILTILGTYFVFKPSLPEIKYVDESELQMPLKVYTKDGVLIGEFGEIKRRSITFDKIPEDIKNAFLAAEDDNFFNHQGISYKGLIRSFIRCLQSSGCQGGGGTITMQVVRGYLLTREQTVIRKIKEIYLALELESNIGKQDIFELYVNKIFLGNRSYGIEAAANTYFDKGLSDLDISESATIAALAQLPSKVNPVKNPRRTELRRNWILSRMLLLGYINQDEYKKAISQEIKIAKNINLYEVDAQHLAELVRQEVIDRYGLRAYKEGWSVYTTIDSSSQNIANQSMLEEMYIYDKRHGWREPDNYKDMFSDREAELLENQELDIILNDIYFGDEYLDENNTANKVSSLFDLYPYVRTHLKALVIRVLDDEIILVDDNFELKTVQWSNEYSWARKKISIDQLDIRPVSYTHLTLPTKA